MTKEQILKKQQHTYIHKKKNKYKIHNININLNKFNMSYSKYINKLIKNEIYLNHKLISEIFKSEKFTTNSLIYILNK